MEELTIEEIKILYNLLGNINYYESMAILCKQYEGKELEEKYNEINKVILKICRIVDPI